MPITRAGGTKGSFYGDSSYRTAAIRKEAILNGQAKKKVQSPANNDLFSFINQSKKPLISEHHLTKGSTNGSMEFIQVRNPNGFI
jgi:hypothetical protein